MIELKGWRRVAYDRHRYKCPDAMMDNRDILVHVGDYGHLYTIQFDNMDKLRCRLRNRSRERDKK